MWTCSLPERLVEELRTHRKAQAEWCLKLGLGKSDLVFPSWSGDIQSPHAFTRAFSREIAATKLPHVTFHELRHTHITHLLRSGVPLHVVSAISRERGVGDAGDHLIFFYLNLDRLVNEMEKRR